MKGLTSLQPGVDKAYYITRHTNFRHLNSRNSKSPNEYLSDLNRRDASAGAQFITCLIAIVEAGGSGGIMHHRQDGMDRMDHGLQS